MSPRNHPSPRFMRSRNVVSIEELRRVCHDPVRHLNDLTGTLYGWRVSLYLTRFFLSFGLPASFASVLMVACGVGGSLLTLFGGPFLVVGLFLLVMAYVLDCVDGEMARYYRIDSYRWACVDYVHHLLTKGLSFLCLGIGLYVEYGVPWTLAMGGACSVFWLLLLGVRDLPTALFAKKIVLNEKRAENPAYQRLVMNLQRFAARQDERAQKLDVWGKDFRFQPWMVRTFFMAFDVAVPLLFAAACIDLAVAPFAWFGVGGLALTTLVLCFYAVTLPLHTVDTIVDALSRGQVRDELYELASKVERFRNHS